MLEHFGTMLERFERPKNSPRNLETKKKPENCPNRSAFQKRPKGHFPKTIVADPKRYPQ